MKLANRQYDLNCIEFDYLLREALLLLKDFVQLAAPHERHNKVKSGFALKQEVHTNEERVINCKKNIFFELS